MVTTILISVAILSHTNCFLYVGSLSFTYHISGNDINTKTQEHLKKAYEVMESNVEENGRLLLRSLFKSDPDLMPHYPFFKDEWNKISYADYAGTHPDQPVNTWFVVFRYEPVSVLSNFSLTFI